MDRFFARQTTIYFKRQEIYCQEDVFGFLLVWKEGSGMRKELVLVLDCGSTNLRAVAVDSTGGILAQASRPNRSYLQSDGEPGWLIWDLDEIWRKISEVGQEVSKAVGSGNIKAVIVTTWGADGAPVKRDGSLTYPPISWQCPRAQETAKKIVRRLSAWEIFQITGYQIISFNTLLRLIWLRENVPKALDEAYVWLMMPGLLVHKLTGNFHIDPTSGSTMMAMDLENRDWSEPLLELAELDSSFFPEWYEPGQIVGYVTDEAAKRCGVPPDVLVVAGGHDTQFALVGSGAESHEAVLSSGTWEILSVRSNTFRPNRIGFEEGLIIEADVQPGLWNPQLLMIGSAVLEWVREKFFPELNANEYATMIVEAERAPPGAGGVTFIPSFVRDSGPMRKYGALGTVLGLTLQASRGQIHRAALEGLSFQLREALRILTDATGLDVKGIRVVGGGSKNDLWNQIRADATNLPVVVTAQKEATALGAALTAFVGIDLYSSLREAQKNIRFEERRFDPSINQNVYKTIFRRHVKALEDLKSFYLQ